MKITYSENETKIYDSYLLGSDYLIRKVAEEIATTRIIKGLPQKRTEKSYINEIKAHNRLYNLGIFRSHTKDTDLEEDIKKWKERIFRIISI